MQVLVLILRLLHLDKLPMSLTLKNLYSSTNFKSADTSYYFHEGPLSVKVALDHLFNGLSFIWEEKKWPGINALLQSILKSEWEDIYGAKRIRELKKPDWSSQGEIRRMSEKIIRDWKRTLCILTKGAWIIEKDSLSVPKEGLIFEMYSQTNRIRIASPKHILPIASYNLVYYNFICFNL